MHWIQDEQRIEYHVIKWRNSAFHNHDKLPKRKLLGGVSFDGGGGGKGEAARQADVQTAQPSFPRIVNENLFGFGIAEKGSRAGQRERHGGSRLWSGSNGSLSERIRQREYGYGGSRKCCSARAGRKTEPDRVFSIYQENGKRHPDFSAWNGAEGRPGKCQKTAEEREGGNEIHYERGAFADTDRQSVSFGFL